MIRTESGRVKVSLIHDDSSMAENIFIYEVNASGEAKVSKSETKASSGTMLYKSETNTSIGALSSQDGSSGPITVISATGCPSCNLANADLSNREFKNMDFSDANLRSVNFSSTDLTSADLLNADLTGISTDNKTKFSSAVWNDGTVCAPSSKEECEPFIFTVQAYLSWQDTGVKVLNNRVVYIDYVSGSWSVNPMHPRTSANGLAGFIAKRGYSMPGEKEGALIGRIDRQQPFLVGSNGKSPNGQTGSLSLIINDDINGWYGAGLRDNIGALQVRFRMSK